MLGGVVRDARPRYAHLVQERPMALLYKADPVRGKEWARIMAERAPDIPFRLWPEVGDPAEIRYIAAWVPPPDLGHAYPNLEVLFSVGAGVDQFDLASLPERVPLVRMIEPGIVGSMVEYVAMAVLMLHRDLVAYVAQQRERVWREIRVRPPGGRRVGVLGLGELGTAVLDRLGAFGFRRAGWSRSRRDLPGVDCFAGAAELPAFLAQTDILVCLLPLTAATRGILDRRLFAALPQGASLVNVGRGPHLVEADLIEALDSGRLSAAVLDVATPEPLPGDSALWRHPRILLTPHIASMTQPETAVDVLLANIRRHQAGQNLVGLVDRSSGY